MTKLTTERLEKKIKSCIEIENCEVMMPLSAAQELLEFRNAAKNSALWLRHEDENHAPDITTDPDVSREWISRGLRVTKLHTAPVLPKQPKPTISFYRDGIIAAAKWVENQRDAYDNEHSQSDSDTGAFEFGNNAQLEYSTTLSEIAEGIRSLHPATALALPLVSFDELMAAVSEVTGVKREFDTTPDKCHQIVPFMNFNSLSRIVEMFRKAQPVSEPYKLEIDMDDADHFSITHLHEIIYGKELIWPEAKLLARFMLDVKQRASAAPAQESE